MRIYESPDALQRYRRTAWEFQQTFQTPLSELPRFVDVILSALPTFTSSLVAIDQIVFEPRYEAPRLCAKYSLPGNWYGDDLTIEAEGLMEARELLQALLSEWIDFLFVPIPERFLIYADHDGYITFQAHRRVELMAVVEALIAAKFRAVEYVRTL